MKILFNVVFFILALGVYQACAATYTGVQPVGDYSINGIAGFQVQNLGGDQPKDVIVYTASIVYAFNSSASLLWSYPVDNLRAVYVSDVNNDGYKEVVVASGDAMNNMEWGNLYILGKDGKVLQAYDRQSGKSYPHILFNSIAAVDYNGDGYEEIVGGSSAGVHAIKDTYDSILWTLRTGEPIREVLAYPVDGGHNEILARSDAYLYLIAMDGTLRSKYNLSAGLKEMKLLDIGPGNVKEVVLVGGDDLITVLDKDLNYVAGARMASNVNEVAAFDINGIGANQMVLGTDNGIYVLNSKYYIASRYATTDAVHGLYYEDWDGDGEKELIFSSGEYIYSVSGKGELKEKTGIGYAIKDLIVDYLEKDKISLAVSSEKGLSIYVKEKEAQIGSDVRERYLSALGLLEMGKYDEAEKSAQEAWGIYTKIGDTANINACQALIEKIRAEKKASVANAAEKNYQEAENYFTAGDYEKSKQYLEAASKAYTELGDAEGIAKCSNLSDKLLSVAAEENKSGTGIPDIMDAAKNINIFPVLSLFLLIAIVLLLAVLIGKKNEKQ